MILHSFFSGDLIQHGLSRCETHGDLGNFIRLLLFSLPIIIIISDRDRERRLGIGFPSSSSDTGLTLDASNGSSGKTALT